MEEVAKTVKVWSDIEDLTQEARDYLNTIDRATVVLQFQVDHPSAPEKKREILESVKVEVTKKWAALGTSIRRGAPPYEEERPEIITRVGRP
jgi:hypothetical protein